MPPISTVVREISGFWIHTVLFALSGVVLCITSPCSALRRVASRHGPESRCQVMGVR